MSEPKKFVHKSAKWLDDENGSAILTRVVWEPFPPWREGEQTPEEKPIPEFQLFDCSRRACIHCFNSNREDQLEKINVALRELLDLRDAINSAWDQYDSYWTEDRLAEFNNNKGKNESRS